MLHQPPFVPAIIMGALLIVACLFLIRYRVAFTEARDRIQRESYGFGIRNIPFAESMVIVVGVLGMGLGAWMIFAGIFRP